MQTAWYCIVTLTHSHTQLLTHSLTHTRTYTHTLTHSVTALSSSEIQDRLEKLVKEKHLNIHSELGTFNDIIKCAADTSLEKISAKKKNLKNTNKNNL